MSYRPPPRSRSRAYPNTDQRTEPYASRGPSRVSDARWQPLPEPVSPARPRAPRPARPRAHRPARPGVRPARPSGALTGAKVVVAVVSLLVLAGTGYYWAQVNDWSDGLTRQNVIAQPPTERPADGAIDILLVGMDSRTDAQGNPLSKELLAELTAGKADGTLNTDTLIMIRIPNDGGKAIGVSMPRDSYVDIPGYGKHKINSAYVRAKNTAMDRLRSEGVDDQAELEVRSNQEGAKSLIGTIERLTGATIDHYAEVNLLGFYDITNAVGGIEVCLNNAVDDDMSGAHLPAGVQTLAGAPALAFVRQRHGLPNGDLDRIVRQQVFMSGMARKVFSADALTPGSETLEKLRSAVQKSVVLDQNWNVIEFAQQMMTFTGGNLEFTTIPVGTLALDTPNDGDAVEVDPRAVKDFVQGLLTGAPPSEPGSATPRPGDNGPAERDVTVDVRNASGRSGLAGQVSRTLAERGFKQGDTGNATARSTSVVRYAAGEERNGELVSGALGGLPAEADRNVSHGRVTVLLGKDFESPAGDQLAGPRPLTMEPPARQQPPPNTEGCVN